MAGNVGERLPDNRQEVLGDGVGDSGVDRPLKIEPGQKAEALGSSGHRRDHLRAQACRPLAAVLKAEYGGPDLRDGRVDRTDAKHCAPGALEVTQAPGWILLARGRRH